MILSRRLLLKNIIIVSGGLSLLPSCFHHENKTSINLTNLQLDGSDEKLLAEIEETLIPATNTPGAKELSIHLFTLKMIDDCYEKEKQDQFIKGLKEINTIAKHQFKNTFIDCTSSQREQILKNIENKKNGFSEDVIFFYTTAKDLTIRGYTTSKYVMTKLVIYELVPGRFQGSFPVTKKV